MCFLADAIFAVLDKEEIKKAVVVGHSLGGYVALSMVDRFPERLSGYVLFHSHPFADTEEVKKNRRREIDIVLSGKKEVIYPINIPKMFANSNLERFALEVERSKEIASLHEAEGIVSIVKGMMNRNSREHVVKAGRVPLLMILGTMDNYIDYESVKARISMPPNGSIETLSKSGHMGFIEEPDRSIEIITKFISNLKQYYC
jgi:pimeloyl-ACP methyl ester carboxylesterase